MIYEVESRPWGMYEILLDSDTTKVKRITVAPGGRLSYQFHHKRAEVWTCIEGRLSVILDDVLHELTPGDCLVIPQGAKHRAYNATTELAKFIEVQTGTYFGEDDIVRIEDDYNRVELEHLKDGNYIGGLTMPDKNTNKLTKNG